MKKRPQQCQRQGKSNTNIKSFINNLKENDLHFEDNQITQCVFLGVLRLKPVPSVFSSNNVPCLVVENKSKKLKNNNNTKEVNKNVSRKKDINKVISGRIGKKNTDKIRASVKKEPLKKAAIKLKFSMNNKDTTSKDSLESVRILPESLTKITSESVLTNRTITLNPITNVPTFNPVQNLFDKLKQQMDDSFNRPSCSSEVNKQTLFSDKSNTDIHLSSKKQKKGINKRDVPKISSVSTFSDNGYHPNSSLNSKLTQDIFLLNEDNATEDCEVLLNTGPMPNFVLDTSTQKIDNDVILITDDNSDISSASKELIVVDDVKCVRSSPRLNRNEQRNSQQKITAIPETIINLDDGESSDKEKMAPKINVEKPKKRRTLMPSAIPSIFFNTPRLLRSELGQKKGSFSETKTVAKNSTTKIQKPENKLDKLPVKQRKDPKSKNSTENIIYEVVKSTENVRFFADVVANSQDDIVLIESSPPKVEPLILKLKKSTEKTADQNAIEDIRNKEKSQKMYTKNVTRNLFFPRLLRSDINQTKDNKSESTKKSTKAIEIGIQKTSQAKNEKYVPSASIGRISVKPTEQLLEKSPQQEEHCRNPVQKVTEKNIGVKDTGKNNEKSLPTPSKMLGSQVQNASNIITIEDSDSTNLTDIFSQNNGRSLNIDNTSSELQNQRQLRSDDSQNKGNESTIEKSKRNIPKTSTITDNIEIIDIEFQSNTKMTPIKKQDLKNTVQEQSHVRQLRSDSPHKKGNNSKPVDIEELNKNNGKSKKHSPKTANDTVENTVSSPMKSENKECYIESIDVDRPCKVDVTPTATKTKNIAVVQPMSRQSKVELPQKKITEIKIINDIQNQNISSLEEVTKSPTKHIVTDISIPTELESQPTCENTTTLATVAVGRFYSNDPQTTPQTGVSSQERRQLRSDDTVDKNTKTENLELNKFKTDMDKLKAIDKTIRNDSIKLEKTKIISKDKNKDTLDTSTVQQKTEFQKQIDSPISKSTEQSDPKILRSSTFSMESKNSSNQVVESKVKVVEAQETLIKKKSIASDRNIQQEPNTGVKSKIILESEDNTIKKYGRKILKCKTNSPSRQKKVITKKSIKKPSKSITFKTITTEVPDSHIFINKEVSKSDGTSTSKKPIVKKIVQTFKKIASKKQLLKSSNLLTKKQSLKLKKKQFADSQITSQSSLIVYSARTPPKAISGTSDSSQAITKTLETPQKDTNIKIISDVQSNTVLDIKSHILKTKDCSSELKTQKTNVPKSDPSKSEKKTESTVSNRNIPNTRPSTLNISQEQSENLDQTKPHFAISSSKSDSKIQTKTKHSKSSLVTLQKKDKMKQKMNLKINKKKLTRNLLRSIKKPAKVAPIADLKIISQSNIILNSRRSISKSKTLEEAFKANQKELDYSEVIKPTGPSTESKVSTNESEDNPVDENGVTGNDIKNKPLKKQKVLSIKKTVGSKIAANIKKTSIKLQNKKHNIEIKRKRGRPRVYPAEIKLDKTPTSGINLQVSTEKNILDKADNAILEKTSEVKRKIGRPKKQQGEAVLGKEQLIAATGEKGLNDTMYAQIPKSAENRQVSTEKVTLDKADIAVLEKTVEVKRKGGRPKKQQGEAVLGKDQLIAATGEKGLNDTMYAQIPKSAENRQVSTEKVTLDNTDNAILEKTSEVKRKIGRPKKQQGEAVLGKEQLIAATGEKGLNDTMYAQIPKSAENRQVSTEKVTLDKADIAVLEKTVEVKRKGGRPKKQQGEAVLGKDQLIAATGEKGLNDTMYAQIPKSVENRQVSTEQVTLDKADNAVLEKTVEVKRKGGRPKKQQVEAVLDKEQLIATTGEKYFNDTMSAESKKEKVATKKIKEEIISDLNEKPQLNEDCLKKMRGKPKKQLQDVTLGETQVSLVEKEENIDHETISQQTNERDSIKKKKGRPKKQQLDIIIDKENSNEEHTETHRIVQLKETDNTKKPRSGPKKISLDNTLTKTLVTEILLKEEIIDNENREELNKTDNSTNQLIEMSVLDNTQVKAFGDENKIMNSSEIDMVKKKPGRPKKQTQIMLDNRQLEFTNVQKIVNNKNSTKISVSAKEKDQTEDILNDTKNSDIQIQRLEISNIKNTKHANAENIVVESIKNENIKRKLGRPKKVKVGDSLDETTVLEVQSCQGITNDKNEVSQSTEFSDKEKNKLDNLITNTNKSNKDQTTVICAEVKKKRGRPSKLPTELKLDLAEADQEQKTKKPKMSGMENNNLQIDLKVNEKTADKNTVNKKKHVQKTQEDLDIIMIVPEKRNKKQINTPLKTLRSSVNQTEKERAVNIAQPVVEKVVALIHSEPRPKQHSDASEITSNHIEDTKESKTRVLRSQNVKEIDSIYEVKEDTKKSRLAKEHKIAKKKKGVSEKSKNIIKNKTKLSKAFAGNKEATKKKILKTDIIDKSKLKKMSNKSKQKVLKQITKKLQNSKNKNILKRPSRTNKSSFNKKRSLDWDNNDIIERIIQEIRNTLFKEESKIIRKKIKQKKIALKTQKKKNTKPERIKREAFLAAKKKMMQTKAALKQKLRNAKNDENTSGGSESKENHPPKKEIQQLEEEKNYCKNDEILVVTTQEDDIMIKDETSFQSDVTNQMNKTNKCKKPESVEKKRRSYRSTLVSRHMAAMAIGDDKEDENIDLKKNDITVFDFDESEPEVTPLRHKSVPKLNDFDTPLSESRHKKTSKIELKSSTPINSYATSNSQKSSIFGSSRKPGPATSVTENEIIEIPESSVSLIERNPSDSQGHSSKIKILKQDRLYSEILVYPDEEEEIPKDKLVSIEKENPVNAEKEYSSPEGNEMPCQELISKRRKLLVPYIDDHGKPKKLWSVIETPRVPDTPPRPITPRQALSSPRSVRRSDSLEMFKPSTSVVKPAESDSPEEKKSPLKQPTIIEMFSKVWMKKELPIKNLSEDNNSKTEESIFQRPITPEVNVTAPSPRRDRGDDEDSDTESRAEWIPEEYAEYKFKYSASKMMQYKPIFKCKICMMVVPSYYKLLKHRKEHENNDKPYKCPQCSSNFSNVVDFSAHLRLHKDLNSNYYQI
ncbi:unnamed protein product [Diabrotica balteata]|uniref:C2H2-type domain-containing protein n=1 Tax=Diabrotica balteata TaxID=107213 RepID=A0A9N9SVK9_DIABA|nr:unnamed protein product [Diabrotica balteata]